MSLRLMATRLRRSSSSRASRTKRARRRRRTPRASAHCASTGRPVKSPFSSLRQRVARALEVPSGRAGYGEHESSRGRSEGRSRSPRRPNRRPRVPRSARRSPERRSHRPIGRRPRGGCMRRRGLLRCRSGPPAREPGQSSRAGSRASLPVLASGRSSSALKSPGERKTAERRADERGERGRPTRRVSRVVGLVGHEPVHDGGCQCGDADTDRDVANRRIGIDVVVVADEAAARLRDAIERQRCGWVARGPSRSSIWSAVEFALSCADCFAKTTPMANPMLATMTTPPTTTGTKFCGGASTLACEAGLTVSFGAASVGGLVGPSSGGAGGSVSVAGGAAVRGVGRELARLAERKPSSRSGQWPFRRQER